MIELNCTPVHGIPKQVNFYSGECSGKSRSTDNGDTRIHGRLLFLV